MRKWMRKVERQWREDGVHHLLKVRVRFFFLRFGQLFVIEQMDARLIQFGNQLAREQVMRVVIQFDG